MKHANITMIPETIEFSLEKVDSQPFAESTRQCSMHACVCPKTQPGGNQLV